MSLFHSCSSTYEFQVLTISQDIPSSGLERWYSLQKPDGKSKRLRGDIKAGLTLSTEKDRNLTAQEHRHLLKILFAYELQLSQAIS